jgi:hypothetical protein
MTPPADFPAPTGPLLMAFAFEAEGREFHLYPRDLQAGQSRLGGPLASLQAGPVFAGPLADALKLQNGGGYGQGSGTDHDVQAVVKKPPSKQQNRTTQHLAVDQLDDLAPLLPIDENAPVRLQPEAVVNFGKQGESILQKVGQADDWSKFMEALDDFRAYLDSGGDKYEFNKKLNDKIFDLLVDQARKLLDKNKGGCLTQDDFKAQAFIERLTNPKAAFSKTFAERFKQKYGQQALDDLAKAKITCSFELTMDSTLTFEAESSTLHATAHVPLVKLIPVYSKGEVYLRGEGAMKQDYLVTGICTFPLKHYDSLTLSIDKLTLIFNKDGGLADFNLTEYPVHGWNGGANASVNGKGKECPTMIQLKGGGDYWTGLFTIARLSLGNLAINGWEVQTNLTDSNSFHSLDANWESVNPAFSPAGVAGATSSEDTKFTLKVTKNSR